MALIPSLIWEILITFSFVFLAPVIKGPSCPWITSVSRITACVWSKQAKKAADWEFRGCLQTSSPYLNVHRCRSWGQATVSSSLVQAVNFDIIPVKATDFIPTDQACLLKWPCHVTTALISKDKLRKSTAHKDDLNSQTKKLNIVTLSQQDAPCMVWSLENVSIFCLRLR